MKPKAQTEHDDGLLEYLEDIIGTSKYKEPIEEALQEMDQLQEDRGEKMNRVRIVEREKNALEDKKKEAEEYLRLQNEHVRALSRLWQWYLWRCLVEDEKLEQKIVSCDLFFCVCLSWNAKFGDREVLRKLWRKRLSETRMTSSISSYSRSIIKSGKRRTR